MKFISVPYKHGIVSTISPQSIQSENLQPKADKQSQLQLMHLAWTRTCQPCVISLTSSKAQCYQASLPSLSPEVMAVSSSVCFICSVTHSYPTAQAAFTCHHTYTKPQVLMCLCGLGGLRLAFPTASPGGSRESLSSSSVAAWVCGFEKLCGREAELRKRCLFNCS